ASFCAVLIGLAGAYLYLNPQIPAAESYRNVKLQQPLRIFSADGALIAEFGERRLIPIKLSEVPQQFVNALLDTEDKRFYEHRGIDFISLSNDTLELLSSLMGGDNSVGGASTITMQLARNVSFTLERRFLRKFKEMLLALKIERELSKDEILELYINLVPFGKRAYGAQAAALTYYGKPLDQLNLAQLAMLAGIPQRPEAGNPINGPKWALRRRNVVLARMLDQQSITESQYQDAVQQPITARVFAREVDVPSPYVGEWVRQQTAKLIDDLYTGGYSVYTSIDSSLQQEAINALRRGLINYDRSHGYRGPEGRVDSALIDQIIMTDTLDPETGETTSVVSVPEGFAEQALQGTRVFGQLLPAVVISVEEKNAKVIDSDQNEHTLTLKDSRWARTYIDVDNRGPRVSDLTTVIAPGDIIRIQPVEKNGTTTWRLAQLPEIQGAVVAMEPTTGSIKALVGGFDFYRNQYNHALQSARQPGSSFKPFIYSAALANGVNAADVFLDAPLVFEDANLESQYRPENDNNRYNGPTRLREALYRSINLVSIRVLLEVGAGKVLDHVGNFGFDTRSFPRNTQLAIGGGTMTVAPLDMSRAYAVLANGGHLVEPNIIDRIVDQQGETVYLPARVEVCTDCDSDQDSASQTQPTAAGFSEPSTLEEFAAEIPEAVDQREIIPATRVIDERNAFIVDSMLKDVIKRGTGRRARSIGRNDLGGKTGTTNDAEDTWFNGYNKNLVTSVWVGFSNQAPLGANAYGSNTPLPIWIDFMEDALAGRAPAKVFQPPGITTMKISPDTGEAAAPGDANAIFEFFFAENAPQVPSSTEASTKDTIKAVDLF
ncbi:MAG: PBP1A family penicillin-binding protein, partial [Pseudomonadota bacterium]|nr:PBP1A family penicillin-binding protein [Pseudomonadota bacterium]